MRKSKNKWFRQLACCAKSGFSLLEMMLAVTILSVGLVMVVRSYITSLRGIKISQDLLTANLLLEEKIWEVQEEQARIGQIAFKAEDGEFEPPFDRFSYKITFEEQEDLPPEYKDILYKTTFELSWGKGEHRTSCVTFLRSKKE